MKLRVDPTALRQARDDLGLSLDAHITWEGLRRTGCVVEGRYNGVDPFHRAHMIALNPNLTTLRASAALWHELTHALQTERTGSYPRFVTEYNRQLAELGLHPADPAYYTKYRAIPYEAEAWSATALAKEGVLAMLVYAE